MNISWNCKWDEINPFQLRVWSLSPPRPRSRITWCWDLLGKTGVCNQSLYVLSPVTRPSSTTSELEPDRMSRATSPLWNHFTIPDGNFRLAKCNHCSIVVQRGTENAPRGKCYNRNMQKHMDKYHNELMEEIVKTQAAVKLERMKKVDPHDESTRGRIPIFNL